MVSEQNQLSYRIARAFYIACFVFCGFLLIAIVACIILAPFMLFMAYFLWLFVVFVILLIPIIIWGITLFVRYNRFLEDELKISEERLWLETIFLNLLNFGLCFLLIVSISPSVLLYFMAFIALWNVIAVILSILALTNRQPKMV